MEEHLFHLLGLGRHPKGGDVCAEPELLVEISKVKEEKTGWEGVISRRNVCRACLGHTVQRGWGEGLCGD